jgi:4,5-dihydroxyphthalate decarboxylase
MARLAITLACGDYDRTRALADGRVTVEGADLTVLALGPGPERPEPCWRIR